MATTHVKNRPCEPAGLKKIEENDLLERLYL